MIKKLNNFLKNSNIFSLNKSKKKKIFTEYFNSLTAFHYKKCLEYKNICKNLNYDLKKNFKLNELPYLPVNIFKSLNLKSVSEKNVTRIMHSSGTTGNSLSKIYLDKANSQNQMKALSKLFSEMSGHRNRLPMLVIDTKSILTNRNSFSARSAAILGFSIFAKEIVYALNDDMTLNIEAVKKFYTKYHSQPNIIFGFTYLIWDKFSNDKRLINGKFNLEKSVLLHGGGWKKLKKKNISNKKFKNILNSKLNIKNIINYYGMVEQTGSIFFECSKCENFVTSIFSDVFIRDKNFNDLGKKKKGMIQLLSVLPTSYPGHNILTEDVGMITEEDTCACGKKGKYFKVYDRLEKAEVRGCGDAISE